MASWSAPVIHAVGDVLSASDWNGLANDATFLYQAPYGISTTVSATLTNNVGTQVDISAATTAYGVTLASNAFVIATAGRYNVFYAVGGAPGAACQWFAFVEQNSSLVSQGAIQRPPSGGGQADSLGAVTINCAVGDTISLWGNQNSGSNVAVQTSNYLTYLQVAWAGST